VEAEDEEESEVPVLVPGSEPSEEA
jgi:hypothetical protein